MQARRLRSQRTLSALTYPIIHGQGCPCYDFSNTLPTGLTSEDWIGYNIIVARECDLWEGTIGNLLEASGHGCPLPFQIGLVCQPDFLFLSCHRAVETVAEVAQPR